MPVVPDPAEEEMPRIAIWLAPAAEVFVKLKPGVRRTRSSSSLTPCASIWSCVKALTLIGTFDSDSACRVAVTVTSSSDAPSVSEAGPTVCESAGAPQNTAGIATSRVRRLTATLEHFQVLRLFMLLPFGCRGQHLVIARARSSLRLPHVLLISALSHAQISRRGRWGTLSRWKSYDKQCK
jgi:hypothetical protein